MDAGDDESDEYMFEALRRRYMSGSEDHTRRRGSSFTGPSSGTGAGAGAGAGSGGGAVSSGSGSMTVATHGDVTVTTNRPRSMSSPLHAELGDEPDEGGDQPTMLRPSARGDSARGKFAVRFDVPTPTNVTRSPARSAGSPSRRSPTRYDADAAPVPCPRRKRPLTTYAYRSQVAGSSNDCAPARLGHVLVRRLWVPGVEPMRGHEDDQSQVRLPRQPRVLRH